MFIIMMGIPSVSVNANGNRGISQSSSDARISNEESKNKEAKSPVKKTNEKKKKISHVKNPPTTSSTEVKANKKK